MQYAIAALALAGAVAAAPKPQAVTSAISPDETTPESCSSSYPGKFMISIANVTSTASKAKRQDSEDMALTITLEDGVLIDSEGRTGYIASNNQFQFDGPAQAGAIYTAGWSACSNGTLALGDSAIFYQCLSGTFYNLYDESTGDQCSQIYINIIGDSSASTTTAASTTIAPAATQLSDGQIQATTATPVVSQITDGQIQATTAAPVTQITDGQIQASTAAAPVTQIADGQIQASNATVAATTAAPVTQIADGQIQASTGTAVVTQISDGQIQAATNGSSIATASPTIQAFTGAAALPSMRAELFGLAGLALAAVAML